MKLKEIYINEEGEPMGNPNDEEGEYQEMAFEEYHSGLLPFEDRESVERLLPRDAFEFFPSNGNPFGGGYRPKPDTLIPIELEVEVVKQSRFKGEHLLNDWIDSLDGAENHLFEYRKVLRIKN